MKNAASLLFASLPFFALVLALFHPELAPSPGAGTPLTDMAGRPIHVAAPAKRALVLPVILSGYVTIDGGPEHVLAASGPAVDLARMGLMTRVYPDIEKIPVVAAMVAPPDPEAVMLLRPDAVFVWAEQAYPLVKVGMPGVVEVKVGGKDQAGSRLAMWRLMGRVAGKETRAEDLLERYRERREALRDLLPRPPSPGPRVAILFRVGNGFWGIGGKSYNLADRLESAGARNAAHRMRGAAGVDLEQLLVLDPDIILLNSAPDEDHPRSFYDRPEWHMLRAVRERRVYKVPVYSYMNAVVNAPVEDLLLVRWMAEVFHPSSVPRGLRDEFRATYRAVYGYPIGDDEIDRAIFLKENLGSAGYERFAREKAR